MEAMSLNVRFFALYRERAGVSDESYTVPGDITVSSLVDIIRVRHPNLAPPEVSIVVAVNGDYASAEMKLLNGDDIALIPPVSGGLN
ncbi:MoaD/ThiS family protein [SAR202 cluster bacterium AD-804-J14_MRT_500m]|nr:MoaD/ThiS family protein [SAR202 cluster bacterium AD-804-J14_MRT_500m]MQF69956.1 MoaD/ThiS family protein [SAR202 cluster bacterium AD-804-J14_MRT_500m]